MNPNRKEAGQQKMEHFKKQALLFLTTAFRAPLMLMTGCGYVTRGTSFMYRRAEIHDHDGKKEVLIGWVKVPYDSEKHGKIVEWVEEGQRVPGVPDSTNGKSPIHRHEKSSSGGSSGAHEYQYE